MAHKQSSDENRMSEVVTSNILDLSNKEQKASYMHNDLLRYILLHMPHTDESKKELFDKLKSSTTKNDYAKHISQKFAEEYKSNEAIRWYTEDSFIYRDLNEALRKQYVDFLYGTRHFLVDLYQQLKQFHLNFDDTDILYRGVILQVDEAEALQKSKGKLVHFDQFISTSMDESVAKGFIKVDKLNRSNVPILFHINISSARACSRPDEEPIAYIEKLSQRPTEKEVLLPPISVFRLLCVEKKDDINARTQLWHIYLELTNARDQELQAVYEDLKKEIFISEKFPTNVVQLAKFLRRLDKIDLAEKYYHIALEDPIISRNYECLTTIYTDLALIHRINKNYRQALDFLEKAESNAKKLQINWFDRPFRMIMGNKALVFQYLGDYDQALKCTLQILSMDIEAGIQNTSEHATTLNNLGTFCMKLNSPEDAIKYFTKLLEIQKRTLSKNHPDIARTYNNMSAYYNKIGNNIEAKRCAREAENIKDKVLPQDHRSVAATKKNLGVAQLKSKQYDEAYDNFEQAGDILVSKKISRDDPELKEIEVAKNSALDAE